MRHALLVRLSVLLMVSVVAAGCDNGEIATEPDPPTVTETFTGTVALNGSQLHPFVATARGTVTATLTAVEPSGSPAVGLSMGTWDGTTCTAALTNNNAVTSSVLTGTVVGITSLCVRIFDANALIPADAPISYTITVVRP